MQMSRIAACALITAVTMMPWEQINAQEKTELERCASFMALSDQHTSRAEGVEKSTAEEAKNYSGADAHRFIEQRSKAAQAERELAQLTMDAYRRCLQNVIDAATPATPSAPVAVQTLPPGDAPASAGDAAASIAATPKASASTPSAAAKTQKLIKVAPPARRTVVTQPAEPTAAPTTPNTGFAILPALGLGGALITVQPRRSPGVGGNVQRSQSTGANPNTTMQQNQGNTSNSQARPGTRPATSTTDDFLLLGSGSRIRF